MTLSEQIAYLAAWYISLTVLGWLAFPIAYRLLPGLVDRGYSLSRALGWLLWGYLFWLPASLGALPNTPNGLLVAAGLLGLLCLWALLGITPVEIVSWLRRNRGMILAVELLALLAFTVMSVIRMANPEAVGTEKPMELAFINAILRSPTFPPHDPWLSGYAISYYHFGYVLVAILAQLTSVPGAVAFNLGIITVFSLGAIGAYGLVYNLLHAAEQFVEDRFHNRSFGDHRSYGLAAFTGPLFLLLVSNLEGFLHVLHTRGIFWQRAADGAWVSPFWRWLDIQDLNLAPAEPFSWIPQRFWWWWRASRVLQDYDLAGNSREIIDEFPFFSFLLSDLHPHVLAIPFGLLALALALNLMTCTRGSGWRRIQIQAGWLVGSTILAVPTGILLIARGLADMRMTFLALGVLLLTYSGGVLALAGGKHRLEIVSLQVFPPLPKTLLLLMAITLGGVAFLNTWDLPAYVALCAAGFALRPLPIRRSFTTLAGDFFGLGLWLGALAGLLYLPFYLSFSSQAGGVIPNLIYPTRGAHLWVMFAPSIIPILIFLFYKALTAGRAGFRFGFLSAGGLIIGLWLMALLLGWLATQVPGIGEIFMGSLAASDVSALFQAAVIRRLTQPGGWITLLALLGLGLSALWLHRKKDLTKADFAVDDGLHPANPFSAPSGAPCTDHCLSAGITFVILLALTGTVLVLGPEFFYLRDQFGWRMNTIFKFYFQAWLVWSIAAAFASVYLLRQLRPRWGLVFGILWILVTAAALVYPPLSLYNKTNGFQPLEWTLDSSVDYARRSPDDMEAIRWLQQAASGVVAEAVSPTGGSYTEYARVATYSGQPNVLGWIGHESQWRGAGAGEAMGSRQADLTLLYCSRDWETVRQVLDQYHIRYVFVGTLERTTYTAALPNCGLGLMEDKFVKNLTPAFTAGGVTVYEYFGSGNK